MEAILKFVDFFHADDETKVMPLATRADDFVFSAGGIAVHPKKGVPNEIKPAEGYPFHWSMINSQIKYIYRNMETILEEAGSSLNRIMKINTYQTNPNEIYESLRLRKNYFGIESPPPSTLVLVPELPAKGVTITTDSIALVSDAKRDREAFFKSTPKAPMPPHEKIWGYRIYIKASRGGGFIFTSGRTNNIIGAPTDSKSVGTPGLPYHQDRGRVATEIIFEYLKEVLKEAGASLEHVVRAVIHYNNPCLLHSLDEVWRELFPNDPPARVFIPVEFPNKYAQFEIELIAIDPGGSFVKETIYDPNVPKPVWHEPQAIKAGPFLFFSGQMATDYVNALSPDAQVDPGFPYHSSPIKKQVEYILQNVSMLCETAGTSINYLVKRRALHADLQDYGSAESAWIGKLKDRLPATTVFKIASPLPVPACLVQYDLIAAIPS